MNPALQNSILVFNQDCEFVSQLPNELHVFALDTCLPLENGFYMNDLYKKMDGHILEQTTLKGVYLHEKG